MAKNIVMKKWNGSAYEELYPVTKARNVITDDGAQIGSAFHDLKSQADEHMADTNNPHRVTTSQIGAETPAGAQAKVNAHANMTNNPHNVTKSQVGLGNVDDVKQAPASRTITAGNGLSGGGNLTADRTISLGTPGTLSTTSTNSVTSTSHTHTVNFPVISVAGKTGAVSLAKGDVGLANVQNYGIATQAAAHAGTANNVYMTPLRTKQAIDQLTGGVPLRVQNGQLEFYDGTGWKEVGGGTDWSKMVTNTANYTGSPTVISGGFEDLITINGRGIATDIQLLLDDRRYYFTIVIDGVEKQISSNRRRPFFQGGWPGEGTSGSYSRTGLVHISSPINFNTRFILRARNSGPNLNFSLTASLVYVL
ncbi:hypothetical protein DUZ99_04565 [Xylanibacillus composti]|uniref:Tail fiber-like repeat protein n=1 Tax=Xylanibacillus composti TaxID=1572762 RepID=A0A8J4H4A0_9BACL|nr:hypothetical protein [Xylanibacillus composti]MDT9724261.1 hypothetical protein [Xylanibacillus composti]GIQ69256.1 hypothetical protein XYCOK13_20800 [Xylanibacillus composti]